MVKEIKLKELNIPYIGIKIDAIPTILEVLAKSASNDDFVSYYEDKGKKPKTALEYLHSLRNIGLAVIDKNKQTILSAEGRKILNDSPELIYKNLYDIIFKKFSDLKFIKDILTENKNANLPLVEGLLAEKGFYIKRKQTLSSYLKLFNERIDKPIRTMSLKKRYADDVELKELKAYFLRLLKIYKKNIFTVKEFKEILLKDSLRDIDNNMLKHIKTLERLEFLRLYYINKSLAENVETFIIINDKYCYKMEIIYG